MNADFIFNLRKVKYEILLSLFENMNLSKSVNIFIDYDTLFETFRLDYYKKTIDKICVKENVFNFVGQIFNLIGHYRNFFSTRLDKNTRFFIIYNTGSDSLREPYIPELWNSYNEKLGNNRNFSYFVLSKCKIITPYFQDISFIDGLDIHHTFIPKVLYDNNTYFKKNTNIFLSDSAFYNQYLELFNGFLLNPSNNSNNIIIGRNQYFDKFLKRNKYKLFTEEESNLSDSMIPIHMSLLEKYDLPLLGTSKRNTVKLCVNIYNKGDYIEVIPEDDLMEFERRFNAFDILPLCEKIPTSDIANIQSQINDNTCVSLNKIHSLNNSRFNNEIRLDWLS